MKPDLPESSAAWELRGAWAAQREVALSLRGEARLRGYVTHVAPTDAFALLWDGALEVHVPCALVRAVRSPHFHEEGWGPPVAPPGARPVLEALPGQLAFDLAV